MLIYQQNLLSSLYLNHDPKCTISFYRNENFPKLEFLVFYFKNTTYESKNLKEYSSINKKTGFPNV